MKILTFLQESDGSYSWARIAACFTLLTSIWALTHVVLKTHALPDAVTLGGLSAFGITPYAANKGLTAFAKKDAQL